MRGPDDFDRRWEASRREFDELRADREAQFDRWTGWFITAVFLLIVIVLALFGAALRWLYLGCAA